jgi:hypothetical protein
MSLHDGAAALLRVRPGSRKPALVWARLAFDGSGEATVLDRSHPEVAVLARSGGVYTLGVPRAAHYQPAGPVALLGAASPFPKLSEPDFAGGTIKATFIDAATPPTSTTGTLLLLGFTGEPFVAKRWTPLDFGDRLVFFVDGARFVDFGTPDYLLIDRAHARNFQQSTLANQPTHSGGAMVLDGTDRVSRVGPALPALRRYSVAFRFSDTGGATSLEVLLALGHPGVAPSKLLNVRTAGTGTRLEWYSNQGARRVDVPYAATATMRTMVLVFNADAAADAQRARAWIDGVEVATTKAAGDLTLPTLPVLETDSFTLFTGDDATGSLRPWVGNVEWCTLISDAISEPEVALLSAWETAFFA